MRLTVLDGITVTRGDLSWEGLAALGDLVVHDRTPPEKTIERAQGRAIVLTNKVVLGADEIGQLPDLRYIGVLATGYNVVDLPTAAACDVTVTHVPAYSTASVAQLVIGQLINMAHGIATHTASVRAGDWVHSPDFVYWKHPLVELAGKTMGLVGFGRIGQAVAGLAQALGMDVIVHTRTPRDREGIRFVSLDEVFTGADVVSLHCPLTPATDGMVNADQLARMKPGSYLINTGRGPLVDEDALAGALARGPLAGAAVDVLSTEPPATDNPLLAAPNCFITPHIGWATRDARQRLLETAVANVRTFLAGRPRNTINA